MPTFRTPIRFDPLQRIPTRRARPFQKLPIPLRRRHPRPILIRRRVLAHVLQFRHRPRRWQPPRRRRVAKHIQRPFFTRHLITRRLIAQRLVARQRVHWRRVHWPSAARWPQIEHDACIIRLLRRSARARDLCRCLWCRLLRCLGRRAPATHLPPLRILRGIPPQHRAAPKAQPPQPAPIRTTRRISLWHLRHVRGHATGISTLPPASFTSAGIRPCRPCPGPRSAGCWNGGSA